MVEPKKTMIKKQKSKDTKLTKHIQKIEEDYLNGTLHATGL